MLSVSLSTQPSNGVVTLNPDGSFKYTPDTNYNGDDSFTYEVSDGNGGIASATVAITIDPVNDCPEAVDDVAVVDEDNSVDINVVANDIDVDVDDAISIDSFTQPGNGIVTQKEDGTLTYEPDENFCSEDSFTYKATDGYCDSNVVTVTITVSSVNDVPVADDDQYTATEDIALEVTANGVLANDVDADGDMLSVSLSTQPSNGVVTLNPDGSFKYTPDTNYNGDDSFTYEVSDGNGGIASATVAITIDPVNDAPVAKEDSYSTDEDTVLQVAAPGVLGTDSDADGDVLMAILASDTSHGSLELNDDGSFTYEPGDNYNGADSFTYKVSDDELESDVATVTITVNPVNDAPEATEDSYSTDEDTPLTVDAPGILANDKDEVERDPLTASMATEPSQGTLALNPDGSFIYTPDANYNGDDSFTYTANDGQDDSNTASVDITVESVNDAPVAVDDSGTVDENTAVDIDVLANDVDNDLDYGDALTIASIANPAHGTAKIKDGAVTYTPNLWYSGEDSFQYTITDTTSLTATATVTITINDVIPSTDDICAFIQELPDSAFNKDASNQKKTFCNKLAAIGKQIANKDYRGAIEKLENDIRSKADGSLGGNPKNDWITDPDAQVELSNMIDTLSDALKALL